MKRFLCGIAAVFIAATSEASFTEAEISEISGQIQSLQIDPSRKTVLQRALSEGNQTQLVIEVLKEVDDRVGYNAEIVKLNEELNGKLKEERTKTAELQRKLAAIIEKANARERELMEELRQERANIEQLESMRGELNVQIEGFKREIAEKGRVTESLNQELAAAKAQEKSACLARLYHRMSAELAQAREELGELKQALGVQKQRLADFEAEIAEKGRVIESRTEELAAASAQLTEAREKISDLEGQVAVREHELTEKLEQQRTNVEQLESMSGELDATKAQLTEARERISSLEDRVASVRAELAQKKETLDERNREFEEQKQALEEQSQALEEQKRELSARVDKVERELSERTDQCSAASAQLTEAQEKSADLEESSHRMTAELAQAREELGELKQALDAQNRDLDGKTRYIEDQRGRPGPEPDTTQVEQSSNWFSRFCRNYPIFTKVVVVILATCAELFILSFHKRLLFSKSAQNWLGQVL
jgi:chromosome segregation ATPase